MTERSDAPESLPSVALCGAFAVGVLLYSGSANANPRSLPFTYPYETLPASAVELEQLVDMTPVRVARETDVGTDAVTSVRSNLETEIEFALTDHVEFAWYTVFRQGATAETPALRFQGVKQRVRFRFAEAGDLPVNIGLYLETAEFHNEFEFEEKLILARRFGLLQVATNLWVEQEYYFQDEDWRYLYNPTLGANYQFLPSVAAGVEGWARGRFGDSGAATEDGSSPSSGPVVYAGPVVMVQSGEGWFSLGAYARLDNADEPQAVGDPWGRVFVRAFMGIGL